MVKDAAIRSSTSICLTIETPAFQALPEVEQRSFVARMVALLEQEGVAYDIASYRDAPPGLRLWGGATVESADMRLLLPWLDWAYAQIAADLLGKAA